MVMKHLLALPYYKEAWKDIKDYEGLYQVSNFGRVRSMDRYVTDIENKRTRLFKGKILKPYICKSNGYYMVTITKDKKTKYHTVHRLVAEAFKPNPHNYPTVDHINRIRTDNHINNLRWAPWELQVANSSAIKNSNKATSKAVCQYSLDMVFIKEFKSTMEVERELNICNVYISRCCLGKRKSAGGYVWKYKEKGT